jgi:stage III sporulation protein AB
MRILAAGYPELPFLANCRDKLVRGEPFDESFEGAVIAGGFDERQRGVLLPLARELGSTDIDSQLAALAYAISRLQEISAQESEYCKTHGKLYRTLGILCGIAAAILVY